MSCGEVTLSILSNSGYKQKAENLEVDSDSENGRKTNETLNDWEQSGSSKFSKVIKMFNLIPTKNNSFINKLHN